MKSPILRLPAFLLVLTSWVFHPACSRSSPADSRPDASSSTPQSSAIQNSTEAAQLLKKTLLLELPTASTGTETQSASQTTVSKAWVEAALASDPSHEATKTHRELFDRWKEAPVGLAELASFRKQVIESLPPGEMRAPWVRAVDARLLAFASDKLKEDRSSAEAAVARLQLEQLLLVLGEHRKAEAQQLQGIYQSTNWRPLPISTAVEVQDCSNCKVLPLLWGEGGDGLPFMYRQESSSLLRLFVPVAQTPDGKPLYIHINVDVNKAFGKTFGESINTLCERLDSNTLGSAVSFVATGKPLPGDGFWLVALADTEKRMGLIAKGELGNVVAEPYLQPSNGELQSIDDIRKHFKQPGSGK